MWFLAGFPDVEAWFHETMNDIARSCKTEDEADKRISQLLGIVSIPQSDVGQGEFDNSQGHLRIRYCRNLIENYLQHTGKPLEVACESGFSPDNIYLTQALLDDLGEESNATFIASMTTKYYMELVRSYANRFPNETSLLATTGIIDAGIYILGHKNIAAEQIVALATETEGCEDRLLHFVMRQVTLLLSVDTPQVPYDAVKEYCEQNADAIRRSVRRTIVSYTGDPMIMQAVRGFMTRDEFAGLREAAGVRPASSWDKIKGLFGG